MRLNNVTSIAFCARISAVLTAAMLAACASSGHRTSAAAHTSQAPAQTAAEELSEFGRFVGTWGCSVQQRQADGSWQTQDGEARWRWVYALGGHAVQDFWDPAGATSKPTGLGTNLRTWNRETRQWEVVWATASQQGFDTLTGRSAGPNMVLRMSKLPGNGRPGHQARITFFDIQAKQFDWMYEASPIDDGQTWSALVQMRCKRK